MNIPRFISAPPFAGKVWVVGGAVRDAIIGKQNKDTDLVTSLDPEEAKKAAEDLGIPHFWKGQAFGVLVLMEDGVSYEMASFRAERYDPFSRKPMIQKAHSIEEDLARRDFTINALAVNPFTGDTIDPFGGAKDLKDGIIRAVGNPEERFAEDPLRVLRAARFRAKLAFEIEPATLSAMKEGSRLLGMKQISSDRVKDELSRIMLSEHPELGLETLREAGVFEAECLSRWDHSERLVKILPEILHLRGLAQNPKYHRFDGWGHTLQVVKGVPAAASLRWAALLHDSGKGLPGIRTVDEKGIPHDIGHAERSVELAEGVLSRYNFEKRFIREVLSLIALHMEFPQSAARKTVLKYLRKVAKRARNRMEFETLLSESIILHQADLTASTGSAIPTEVLLAIDDLKTLPFYSHDLGEKACKIVGLYGPSALRDVIRATQDKDKKTLERYAV